MRLLVHPVLRGHRPLRALVPFGSDLLSQSQDLGNGTLLAFARTQSRDEHQGTLLMSRADTQGQNACAEFGAPD